MRLYLSKCVGPGVQLNLRGPDLAFGEAPHEGAAPSPLGAAGVGLIRRVCAVVSFALRTDTHTHTHTHTTGLTHTTKGLTHTTKGLTHTI